MIQHEERFQYPDEIKRVTAGPGGEVILIMGQEKTAVVDCGMAFCGDRLVTNIRQVLGDRELNYILLTHSHYDHMGALPYLKKAWPSALSTGAQHAQNVLKKQSARNVIRELSMTAWEMYRKSPLLTEYGLDSEDIRVCYDDADITVDHVAREGDLINLGGLTLQVLETPGHTDCSLSFYLTEKRTLFSSETMGCPTPQGEIMMAMLKGYRNTIRSIEKGRQLKPDCIIAPHYGKIPHSVTKDYWTFAKASADECRDFIVDRYNRAMTEEEIYQEYQEEFWHNMIQNQQPLEAFEINGRQIIKAMIREQSEYL